MILFVTTPLAGFCGFLSWVIVSYSDYPREPQQQQQDYLLGGSLFLVALGGCLSGLFVLLRQSRLAAWFQWLAALGWGLFTGLYFLFERQRNSLEINLLTIGVLLLICLLFVFSGRFLRSVEREA